MPYSYAIKVVVDGKEYPSKAAAIRELHVSGHWLERNAVFIHPAPVETTTEGRIAAAAQKIVSQAAKVNTGKVTAYELKRRRKGLLKAIWLFKTRYGVGITEALERYNSEQDRCLSNAAD